MNERYDIVVIGAGHAGCEAAYAAARMGARTLLLTMQLDHVALMSCNPSVGGLAKGHLVREIDALGGVMAWATDQNGIQFRMLNTSKGPAVRAPRAQVDKLRYTRWMKHFLENVPNLELRQETVERILFRSDGRRAVVDGVLLQSGERVDCRAVVVTTGTFLDGVIHVGDRSYPAGRAGETASLTLSDSLRELGLQTGRLKTGTPARVDRRSINWDVLEVQPGDVPPPLFSYRSHSAPLPQVPCYLTYTNAQTHRIILDNLHRSALYGGYIKSVGPRYCPSIEDKCVRFADKDRHQVFLEPEGLDTNEIYVNGVSTSLPADVQRQFLRTIRGLENVQITRIGYAIEYTFVFPSQLHAWLECKDVAGLFLAGQINGTTGYEEAAVQGLMAGVNAVLVAMRGAEPFVLRRDEAYVGVLVDDLITKDHREPYRMFTSRAEYRLLLRQDNADLRLTDYARKLGLISEEDYRRFAKYRDTLEQELTRLRETTLRPATLPADLAQKYDLADLKRGITLWQLLARPDFTHADLDRLGFSSPLAEDFGDQPLEFERLMEQAELVVKYEGYITRQQRQAQRLRNSEELRIPPDFDYERVKGLRKEAAIKLSAMRPDTLGQAMRIAGVNPADISILLLYLRAPHQADLKETHEEMGDAPT
jgi:tRNA uridine 5-carboxymethylaminomethyl modification enzyme